jgi:catechol-2,3-dioxygenase
MKLNLDTIIVFVQNVEKLKSFYIDILKLDIVEETKSEWLLLKASNCKIGLHKIGDQYLDNNKEEFKFHNNTKIVFEVDEDIKDKHILKLPLFKIKTYAINNH